ncbi:enoyl-CoA hydratase/isomerase family protein [Mesorhizobium sp. M7A.F.Ca.US.011.01.1.1]|uniref:enoyl-CoA hydratase/isomerase family protein n=1 Tax=Mesorhizobium sp. M7A.F.Ca.US.011.01.1.1 TaxID=2496741 RepID=UPI000FCB8061|nr:enoyl-CoA hydratase-related protein [Mesorhizobium sp. M7A.F.Ca.US.011.01.1.1]RUX22133.1 enoyl-CoA hydratase/isomerase family protein [Mesorhizobium sp. M7A.F.Ca.US.011.01.1.1]
MSVGEYSNIISERRGAVGFITLNRPKALNALNGALMDEVSKALKEHVADPDVRTIVLSGNGAAFSSGFDLKEAAVNDHKTTTEWRGAVEGAFEFIMQFWDCPKPTVSAIHGFCLAGALELSLACDITIADEETYIGEPEVRFGAGVVALLLPWLIPPKIAKEFLLTGNDRVPARRAYEIGLINHLVPGGKHLERAAEIAEQIARCSPDAVRMTKRAVNRSLDIGGMRSALLSGVDTGIFIEATESEEKLTFNRLTVEQGLKAAISWRDAQHRNS